MISHKCFRWIIASTLNFFVVLSGSANSIANVIPIDAFNDGISHYQNALGRADYGRYGPDQFERIADNILLHQRSNGGWPSNWDPLRILDERDIESLATEREREDTSFDNRATYPQVAYLARAYHRTGREAYRDGALAGLAFILEAQYESGGWPHSYPNTDNYRPHITFMDDVMTGVLSFLRAALADVDTYGFVESVLRARMEEAVRQGDQCILRLQIEANGRRCAWAGQYDRYTLAPTQARAYELPAIVSAESVGVVRYLMGIDPPTHEIFSAVQDAVRWFEESKIEGIRVETVEIEPVRYEHHTATTDRRVVEDLTARPIWARFYEIETNCPFMANRDGKKVYSLAEVAHERRTGYGWYTYAPSALLEKEYPRWYEKWASQFAVGIPE